MVSRIDIIGQNGGDGLHYIVDDLKKYMELHSKYIRMIRDAAESFCNENDWGIVSVEPDDSEFYVEYVYWHCECCGPESGGTYLTLKELISYIEDTNTNT